MATFQQKLQIVKDKSQDEVVVQTKIINEQFLIQAVAHFFYLSIINDSKRHKKFAFWGGMIYSTLHPKECGLIIIP